MSWDLGVMMFDDLGYEQLIIQSLSGPCYPCVPKKVQHARSLMFHRNTQIISQSADCPFDFAAFAG
jgi:hypothetical protein